MAFILFKNSFPASKATLSGLKGAIPLAIRSAFIKFRHSASTGRKFSANVVFPAPFGPAMFEFVVCGLILLHDGSQKYFVSKLTETQKNILSILEVPEECYTYPYLFDTS
jgi:hypothetical protein